MTVNRLTERLENTLESVSEQAADCIRRGQFTLDEFQHAVSDKSHRAARATDDYVHENAWKALGLVAILGVLIGFFIPRR